MIRQLPTIIKQMGLRYSGYRAWYELRKRTGLLKRSFPLDFSTQLLPTLAKWRENPPKFLLGRELKDRPSAVKDETLLADYQRFLKGDIRYFNNETKSVGRDYDWLTNPATGHRYVLDHWTEIPDLSAKAGDIKYVWEKSRFSYLLTLIRYDHHYGEALGEVVFSEIESWLEANPLNLGPNYICSQETSLRLLNWTFALYYYKNDAALTQVRWKRIMQSIYGQLKHVRANIHFSRITVRNNHAITETLMLYLGGLLFPWFPEAVEWKRSGKAWFEDEIAYQIYDDGTFLQHSHNYHRVLVQLLSYAISISGANGERFSDVVYDKAALTLNYLYQCTQPENGHLPNYGSNDGALFFPLASQTYRDYRPQLNGLSQMLYGELLFSETSGEEAAWLSSGTSFAPAFAPTPKKPRSERVPARKRTNSFPAGGIYTYNGSESFVFLHCQSYNDRPFQADNLHFDLWLNGQNFLRDAGTYRYNTDPEKLKFFMGTAGHNTVMLGKHDQMLKGSRFIWLHWPELISADLSETDFGFRFVGEIRAFRHLGKDIRHRRLVEYNRSEKRWVVEDTVDHTTGEPLVQHWNPHPDWEQNLNISAKDENGRPLEINLSTGYFSGHYGEIMEAPHITFSTSGTTVRTSIRLRQG
jgi:hypothetical protein